MVRGSCGNGLTGNRGSLFLFGTSGRGGWAGGLEPANHGRGQEPTSKTVIPTTHTSRSKTGNASSLVFLFFPHQLHDVGARGAKELGRLRPGNHSRDEAKRTHTHTHLCHPPIPSVRLHHQTHTRTNDDTQTCTTRRLVCSSDRQGLLRFPARLGILLLPATSPPSFPLSRDPLHASCTKFVGFSFSPLPPCSDNVFFYPCELFIMSHT